MIIRRLNDGDISSVAEIERECFTSAWSIESIKSSFDNASNHFFGAQIDGKIAGYLGLSVIIDEGYILNVAVSPDYRRKGIAKSLLNHIIDLYKDKLNFITLEVRPSNTAAVKLYESFGFERVGERKNYYNNPDENALLLTKFFNSQ